MSPTKQMRTSYGSIFYLALFERQHSLYGSQNVNIKCRGLADCFPDKNRVSSVKSMNGVHMETGRKEDSGWPLTDRQARSGAIGADFKLLFHRIDPYWGRFGILKIKNRIRWRESQRK
jgi:hypothetical protein